MDDRFHKQFQLEFVVTRGLAGQFSHARTRSNIDIKGSLALEEYITFFRVQGQIDIHEHTCQPFLDSNKSTPRNEKRHRTKGLANNIPHTCKPYRLYCYSASSRICGGQSRAFRNLIVNKFQNIDLWRKILENLSWLRNHSINILLCISPNKFQSSGIPRGCPALPLTSNR